MYENDAFLDQGHRFQRWVVVGHWPVTLYHPDIPSAKPLLLPDRHIASIDGGCTLKADGQLNALILPREPGGAFSYRAYDGFPVMTALASQAPSPDPLNIRWGHSALEVLSLGRSSPGAATWRPGGSWISSPTTSARAPRGPTVWTPPITCCR